MYFWPAVTLGAGLPEMVGGDGGGGVDPPPDDPPPVGGGLVVVEPPDEPDPADELAWESIAVLGEPLPPQAVSMRVATTIARVVVRRLAVRRFNISGRS
jgi:hypothetical protein